MASNKEKGLTDTTPQTKASSRRPQADSLKQMWPQVDDLKKTASNRPSQTKKNIKFTTSGSKPCLIGVFEDAQDGLNPKAAVVVTMVRLPGQGRACQVPRHLSQTAWISQINR